MAHFYRVKNTFTGQYVRQFTWDSRIIYSIDGSFMKINEVNYIIDTLCRKGLSFQLINLEIETYEPTQIKSKIKIQNIRDRVEKQLMMEKLKHGT